VFALPKPIVLFLLAGSCVLGGLAQQLNAPDPESRIAFLQVGQGDCTLIQSGGRSMIIDSGYGGQGFDAGERLVSRELYRLAVKRLDIVILTHPDADHIGGLRSIANRFEIGKVVIPLRFLKSPAIQELEQMLHIPLQNFVFVNSHTEFILGEMQIRCDCPPPDVQAEDNAGSMLTRVTSGMSSALIMGDATIEEEAWYMEQGKSEPTQILKLGHHGSQTSSSTQFLEAIRPNLAIISCGRGNRYGHPHRSVMDSLIERKIASKRTDLAGTLIYHPGPDGFVESAD